MREGILWGVAGENMGHACLSRSCGKDLGAWNDCALFCPGFVRHVLAVGLFATHSALGLPPLTIRDEVMRRDTTHTTGKNAAQRGFLLILPEKLVLAGSKYPRRCHYRQ